MEYRNAVVWNDLKELKERNICWESLRGTSVLVTGANGMLATYIVYMMHYLNAEFDYNIKIYALVRNRAEAQKKFGDLNVELVVQDVCEEIHIQDGIDYIFHLAGNASPKHIVSGPIDIIRANTLGTLNVLEFARRKKVKKVLFASTREVYGKMDKSVKMIKEDDMGVIDCHNLRASYPESKRMAETIFYSFYEQYGVPYSIVRIAHSYGPGMKIDDDGRVMADFISDVVNRRNIVLKSAGTAERAFCYISDAVAGMMTVMQKGENQQAYNIANEAEPYMIRDVAKMLIDMFPEFGLELEFDESAGQAGYSKLGRTCLSTDKLEKLGWKCEISLKDGLQRTVKSFL